MQRFLSGFGFRHYDERANVHTSNEDYAGIALMLLEFFAEVSAFKCLEQEHDYLAQMFANFINPKSQQYEDSKRQKIYSRREHHRCTGAVGLEELRREVSGFEKFLHEITSNGMGDPFYGYDYHNDSSCNKFKIKVNRNFVSDLHQLSSNEVKKVLEGYFLPICRGQIIRKDFISNNRKYSEDSFEFYTPIKDTNLILTWRFFADLEMVNSAEGNSLVLQYILSFDAIREEEFSTATDLYSISDLLSSALMNKQRKDFVPYGEVPDNYDDNYSNIADVAFSKMVSINRIVSVINCTDSNKWRIELQMPYPFNEKGEILKDYYYFYFTGHKQPSYVQIEAENVSKKWSAPDWIYDRVKILEKELKMLDEMVKDRTRENRELVKEYTKELNQLQDILDCAYEVYITDLTDYSVIISQLPRALQIYYQKADPEVLVKSLHRTGLIDTKFTDLQKQITFASENELFFGRSGTGKTHCCVHALVARHLTVDAIARKLQQKVSDGQNKDNRGLKSIFITASPLLAKEVKAQYETTLRRAEKLNSKEEIVKLTEDLIFENLHAVQTRSKELPKTFLDEDITFPLFLSHQEFVTILYSTMVSESTDFKHVESTVKIEAALDDKIIEKRIRDIVKAFGQQEDKMKKALRLMPKRRGKSIGEVKTRKQLDFKMFYDEFYKKKVARNFKLSKISSNVAWSEIRTKIKGGSFAYFEECCGGEYNPNNSKLKETIKNNYFALQTDAKIANMVFEIFESYEAWKQENNYFDIEDFVGLFYRKIKKWPFKVFNFDLVVIDEVQDLSFNSISVLTNLCLNNFMICGDNAQNIEKGINFKFKDLRGFLNLILKNRSPSIVSYGDYTNQENNLPLLSHYHLGLNFRSSKEILDLANLIVCLLETYFGNEIDSFPKEKGFFSSPKPLILDLGLDIAFLVNFLEQYLKVETMIESESMMDDSIDTSAVIVGKKIRSGNDFCIIVRDEAAKALVPEALKNCIVLTLQESKGLEFENVLLFNHFTSNDAEKGWRYIYSRTEIEESKLKGADKSELENETDLFRRSKLELQKLVKEESELIFKFSTNAALDQISVQSQLEGLSADMKFLYVAITRAKKNLIIYDYSVPKTMNHVRIEFDKICKKLDLAEFVTTSNSSDFNDRYKADPNWRAVQQQLAREKGFCFLKQGEYASAERFFKASNDSRLVLYCKASEKAKAAGDLLSLDFDEDLKKKYTNISDLQSDCSASFREAAEMFLSLDKSNEAGKCFFNAEDYAQAADCFRKADNKINLAHSLFMLQKYETALPIYYELEQDELVQACLYNLSEGGKDMTRFASMLAGMSDESKQLAQCDDHTFMGYIMSVFDELQQEIIHEDDFTFEDLTRRNSQKQAPVMVADKEEEMSEMKMDDEHKEDKDSFVVVSDRKSIDDFQEIRSVLSDLKSAGGSFEKLPSLRNEAQDQSPTVTANSILSRLETHFPRIKKLMDDMPGKEILFIKQREENSKNMMFDLAVIYKFEELGLELLKAMKESDAEMEERLITNKLLNIDFNICSSRRVDLFSSKEVSPELERKHNVKELVTLNVFDVISTFKFASAFKFDTVDDIIKHLFFHICIMGLAEYFYPMAIDASIKEQLGYFISQDKLAVLQSEEIAHFKVVSPMERKAKLSNGDLLSALVKFMSQPRVFSNPHSLNQEELQDVFDSLAELLTRLVRSHESAGDREKLSEDISASQVWHIIQLLRILFKKRYSICSHNKGFICQAALKILQAHAGSTIPLISQYLEDFILIRKSSPLFDLINSNPELSMNVRTEKDFSLFSINQENDVFLIKEDLLNNLAFNIITFELLSLYKIRSQNDLITLEVLSQLSTSEKTAIKFSKFYSKKSEEILLTFDFGNHSSATLEDYIYSKILSILGKGEKQENCNFFTVYQYYNLLTRNTQSSSVIAALIRLECAKRRNNRVFFLLDEVDQLTREGEIGKAYYRLKDLHDYCDEKGVQVNKSAHIWLMMKELFLLLWAHAVVVPTEESSTYFSFPNFSLWPSYFKEEFKRMNWIVSDKSELFMVEDLISLDSLDEIAHNLSEKISYLIDEKPTSLFLLCNDLEVYFEGLMETKGKTIEYPELLKVYRLSKSHLQRTSEILEEKEEQIRNEANTIAEATELAENIQTTFSLKKKLVNSSKMAYTKKISMMKELKGKILTTRQVRQPLEEIYQNRELKSNLLCFILNKRIAASLEYHFLVDVIRKLNDGLRQDSNPDRQWYWTLTAITNREKKRFDDFLEQKKVYSAQSKKEAEQFQQEIKKRLKLASMIGGQIYKRISDKLAASQKINK